MFILYQTRRWPRETALSLAAEKYIRAHSVGGVVHTPGQGGYYDETCNLDMSAAWLSKWCWHPDGAPGSVSNKVGGYADYFVRNDVVVDRPLPLGPFPVRVNTQARVLYPTDPGVYRDVFLWKSQVEDCEMLGVRVRPIEGLGWEHLSNRGEEWSQWLYDLRVDAPTEEVQDLVKLTSVAAMGRHGMGRTHYVLASQEYGGCEGSSPCLVSDRGEPLSYQIVEEYDAHSAPLVHFNRHTIAAVNSDLFRFALPYASQGRLLMVDYDAAMVLMKEEEAGEIAVKKGSPESFSVRPGSFKYQMLHEVKIKAPRIYQSLEVDKTIRKKAA